MKVILKQDIKNLGDKDEMVEVKNGYANNFLIPKGMAEVATAGKQRQHAEILKQRAYKQEKLRQEAIKKAEFFKDVVVKVGAKAGENGKIFGSVTAIQIADAVKKLGQEIDRKSIMLEEDHIKTLGTYSAKARLMKDVFAEIHFEVVEE